jgi:phosphoglycolate phosphatase-like HAD superfamily hydrolase
MLIIFDFDGTLIDVWERYYFGMVMAFSDNGVSPPTLDRVKEVKRTGHNMHSVLEILGAPRTKVSKINERRLQYTYDGHYYVLDKLACEPSVILDLAELHDLAILTARSRPHGIREMLRLYNVNSYFKVIMFGGEKEKTAPKIMEHFGATPEETWLVSDMPQDIEAATKVGARPIGVEYGMTAPFWLRQAGATAVVDDLEELLDL